MSRKSGRRRTNKQQLTSLQRGLIQGLAASGYLPLSGTRMSLQSFGTKSYVTQTKRLQSSVTTARKPIQNKARRVQQLNPVHVSEQKSSSSNPSTICDRRQVRREVLHSLQRTGTGSTSRKKSYSKTSKIKC